MRATILPFQDSHLVAVCGNEKVALSYAVSGLSRR